MEKTAPMLRYGLECPQLREQAAIRTQQATFRRHCALHRILKRKKLQTGLVMSLLLIEVTRGVPR
jgi:hypothetical protein